MAVVGASAFRGPDFRGDDYVSCSGGPCPAIPKAELVPVGQIEQRFWRWKTGRRHAGNDEEYLLTVPLWSWKGTT